MTLRLDTVRVVPRGRRDDFDRLRAVARRRARRHPAAPRAPGTERRPEGAHRVRDVLRRALDGLARRLLPLTPQLFVDSRGRGAILDAWQHVLPWGFLVWVGLEFGGAAAPVAAAAAARAACFPAATAARAAAAAAERATAPAAPATTAERRGRRHELRQRQRQWQRLIIDASLDIGFPDVFGLPDTGSAQRQRRQLRRQRRRRIGCSPTGVTCQGSVAYICSAGTLTKQTCSGTTPTCANGFGCVACVPGTGSCNGNVGTACNPTGTGTVTNNCDPALGESCVAATGQCAGDCANVGASYIGCEYYAVTMSNTQLAQASFDYSVSISNTSGSKSATIVITGPSYNQTVHPRRRGDQQLCPARGCRRSRPTTPRTWWRRARTTSRAPSPSRSTSSTPTSTPRAASYSYTNDASLLIPVNAMTGNYRVAGGSRPGATTTRRSSCRAS